VMSESLNELMPLFVKVNAPDEYSVS